MTPEEYYNRDKSYSYKAVFWSIIGFIIIVLLLISCIKIQPEYCWECRRFVYERTLYDNAYYEKRYELIDTLCGWTERDALRYEKYHTVPMIPISTCGDEWRQVDCACGKIKK